MVNENLCKLSPALPTIHYYYPLVANVQVASSSVEGRHVAHPKGRDQNLPAQYVSMQPASPHKCT